MLLPDLRQAARRPLQDSSFEDEELDLYANEALRLAASRVFLPDLEAAAAVAVPAGAAGAALPGNFQKHLFAAVGADGRKLIVVTAPADIRRLDLERQAAGAIRHVAQAGNGLRVWPAPVAGEAIRLSYFRLPRTMAQTSGPVAFRAAGSLLSADAPRFDRFRFGDAFTVSGSAANDGAYTVEAASDAWCRVAEAVTDEAAVLVNIEAKAVEGVPEYLHRDVVLPGLLARAFDSREDAFEGKRNALHYRALFEEGLRALKLDIVSSGWRPPPAGPSGTSQRLLA
ncbi:hypothetical protein [Solidesulfovibrio magneticus]|uniref:Uncharacterized protein n=1 Tax=Solidesulfovibrio magneticus (strain ATCC 700980 / DSM 13731 / RS-1) TaxID=573370 RepID=C4XTJ6_SOLM1|nr:hypothetical protein [Solidesulfovibrio magneticus]BAH75993.1 hypothetical protein DMR_25020 [Solidesulfovibrio magneticus RS-1]